MKLIICDFKDFTKQKPKTFDMCAVLWNMDGKQQVSFGIYYEDKNAFFDGIGGWLDGNSVIMWANADNATITEEG